MSQEKYLNAIYVNNAKKVYGKKTILENINLEIKKGEFVSLIGPSGCGKSTLLKLLMGEEKASSGEVYINGVSSNGNIEKGIGIVYQKYSLFPHLSIKSNLDLALNARLKYQGSFSGDMSREDAIKIAFKKDFHEMIRLFRIEDLLNKYPHECSGGQQQRASIVQSLLARPEILFMDEAFGALDVFTKIELKEFIDEYWKTHNTTIVFITHDLNDAVSMGSRVILLSQYYEKTPEMGSKIVYDQNTKLNLTPVEKEELIFHIKREGFDPSYLQKL